MKTQLIPYLNFDGNWAEAMEFYRTVFGGELKMQTFGEAYGEASAEVQDRVMHARLEGDGITIMASDTHPGNSEQVSQGTNVHMSLVGTDKAKISEYFNRLSEGGQVTMPLAKQFWGAEYGALTDPFGVQWMFNISSTS